MTDRASPRCGRRPAPRLLLHIFIAVLLGLMWPLSHAVDDPYLQLLDEEVTKVGGAATDTEEDGAAPAIEIGESGLAPSREQFEVLLREQHMGTYSFYRRLPQRSREEIFVDFSNGASMESLRDKTVDRFLHP